MAVSLTVLSARSELRASCAFQAVLAALEVCRIFWSVDAIDVGSAPVGRK
ncbi:MAG: hypothetical protein R2736_05835 [Solirubrobacterales bacterium]